MTARKVRPLAASRRCSNRALHVECARHRREVSVAALERQADGADDAAHKRARRREALEQCAGAGLDDAAQPWIGVALRERECGRVELELVARPVEKHAGAEQRRVAVGAGRARECEAHEERCDLDARAPARHQHGARERKLDGVPRGHRAARGRLLHEGQSAVVDALDEAVRDILEQARVAHRRDEPLAPAWVRADEIRDDAERGVRHARRQIEAEPIVAARRRQLLPEGAHDDAGPRPSTSSRMAGSRPARARIGPGGRSCAAARPKRALNTCTATVGSVRVSGIRPSIAIRPAPCVVAR